MKVRRDEQQQSQAPASSAAPRPAAVDPGGLLQLQRLAGNRAVVARLASGTIRRDDDEPAVGSLFDGIDTGTDGAPKPKGLADFDNSKRGGYDASLFTTGLKGGKEPEAKAAAAAGPGKAFDHAKAAADLATLASRVTRFPALGGSDFLGFMKAYVDAAGKGDDALAQEEMEMAIACLKSLNAFTIGNVVYARQGADTDSGVLADLAEEAMQGVVLWSKLNKYKAIETVAGGEKGNSLEASAAGSLFDDLSFGMDYGSHAVLRKQWSLVSQSFVTEARGVVHAQVLEGIDPNSVLTTTEWPIISQLMRQGVVVGFVVHLFEYKPGKDGAPGELVEFGQKTITHPNQWNSLPSVTEWSDEKGDYAASDGYKQRQGEAHFGELDRHKKEEELRQAKARFVEA
jgi:hypothetical protein